MIKLERTSVMNLENAMRGARNPMNSWGRMDSSYDEDGNFCLGPNDLDLGRRLRKAGSDHRKFIRQIFVSVDITAPLYWWKEYDTYKVATVANSTSTMHKIHSKPFDIDDFSHDHLTKDSLEFMGVIIDRLECIRQKFVAEKKKEDWYDLIQLLPSIPLPVPLGAGSSFTPGLRPGSPGAARRIPNAPQDREVACSTVGKSAPYPAWAICWWWAV